MSIQAQRLHRSAASHTSAERSTAGQDPKHRVYPDTLTVLDHRTRARCIPRRDAPPGRYLEAGNGDRAGLIPLDTAITHIGRGLGADVRLQDAHVSRRHAIVAQRGDGARVLDNRSRNGTFVNGREVTVGYLNDGDVLRLGRVVFRFIEVEPHRTAESTLARLGLAMRARTRRAPAGDLAA